VFGVRPGPFHGGDGLIALAQPLLHVAFEGGQAARQLREPVRAKQPFRRRGSRPDRDKTVPATETAVAGHEALAYRERLPTVLVGDCNLLQPTHQLWRCGYEVGKALGSGGQSRIRGLRVAALPTPGAFPTDRRIRVFAERGCERAFKSRLGAKARNDSAATMFKSASQRIML